MLMQSRVTDERLLAAAKTDNEELLEAAFADPDCNVNWQDGLGNTGVSSSIRLLLSLC